MHSSGPVAVFSAFFRGGFRSLHLPASYCWCVSLPMLSYYHFPINLKRLRCLPFLCDNSSDLCPVFCPGLYLASYSRGLSFLFSDASNNIVATWGSGEYGQLGLGLHPYETSQFHRLAPGILGSQGKVVEIFAAYGRSAALTGSYSPLNFI
jgi:hypothetical protein